VTDRRTEGESTTLYEALRQDCTATG